MISQKHNNKISHTKWTDDQRRLLLKIAGTMSIDDVAKALKVSVLAAKRQCGRQFISYSFVHGCA